MHRTTRRRLLLAGGTAAAGIAGCLGRTEPSDSPDGTTTRTDAPDGTPPGTATTTDTTTPPDSGASPGVAWRREVGSPVTDTAAGNGAVVVGTEGGGVAAVGTDGGERWTADTDGPVQQVASAGDLVLVVVGDSALYSNHRVVALDAATGEDRWEFAPEEWWLEVVGTHEGTAYVATSDDAISPGGQTLYAVSRADGTTHWSGEVGDNSGGLVTDDAIYVPTFGRIYAYGHDGTRLWARDVAEYGFRSIVTAGDVVAFAGVIDEEDGRRQSAIGLSPADGTTRWTVDGWYVTSLVAHGGRLYAGGEHVVEIDPATGETGWRFDPGGSIYDSPVAGGALFASGPPVHAVALGDGSSRWSFESDLHLASPGAVAGDTLYVHASKSRDDRNRHVVALGVADGEERWRFAAETRLTSTSLAGGRPVAGSEGGVVYGFE